MKKKLSILLCLTLLILSGCRASGNTIRFGAADIGGMYYSFATLLLNWQMRNMIIINLKLEPLQVHLLTCDFYLTTILS